ncbi:MULTISPECIES: cytochrome P450 family protein [Streptomyces]|uniref:Cytochrome P450 n=1 Tax=Streptomyces solicathayae TaxID=3081768 RepID=A0ABZ0LPF6_9ACTN|nr:cytochrome P450 [Streptomyces sp. HUAS YS2]WOX21383.1 cytochrome P450 [Streptomyces sp. HUAS YS2]
MAGNIVDLRVHGQDFARNPYPYYEELRRSGPVHRAILQDDREAWLVLGYEESKLALTHPGLAKDWRASPAEWREQQVGDANATAPLFGLHILVADHPDHGRLRKPAAKAFSPRRLEALRPRVTEIVGELTAALSAESSGRRADLVEDFAFPLSLGVICDVLGVPFADQQHFRAHSRAVVCPTGKDAYLAACHALVDYLGDLIDRKRAAPGPDLLSTLIECSDEDRDAMSPTELRAAAFVLLVAGHETSVNLISGSVFALLRHPRQLAAVREDPGLIDNAVEETLRYDGPAEMTTRRFAAAPVRIGDTVIPGDGDEVLIVLASANHDHAYFPDPQRFDIHRDTHGHLAFGHGMHFCLGAALARMEGQLALRGLLRAFPDLALDADPATLAWRPGCPIRGLERLPVRY